MISDCAILFLPFPPLEEQRDWKATRRSARPSEVGPAYGDKAARTGLRMADLMQPALFSKKLQAKVRENNSILHALGAKAINYREVNERYLEAGRKLRPFVSNTVVYLHRALQRGKEILFEGAQGTFLDIDHGTYRMSPSSTDGGRAATVRGTAASNGFGSRSNEAYTRGWARSRCRRKIPRWPRCS